MKENACCENENSKYNDTTYKSQNLLVKALNTMSDFDKKFDLIKDVESDKYFLNEKALTEIDDLIQKNCSNNPLSNKSIIGDIACKIDE